MNKAVPSNAVCSAPQRLSGSRQLSLSIDLPPAVPLVHVETAQNILNCDNDRICEAIELGVLLAFNIAAPATARAEIRIYRDSLRCAALNKSAHPAAWCHPRFAFSTLNFSLCIASCLVPGDKPFFPLKSLARRWSCSPTHLYTLLAAGCLASAAPPGRGPAGSAQILRASAQHFLQLAHRNL